MPPAMPALIVVNVGGEYTHYAPAERCVVTIRVSKEGDSQAYVLESVSDISNELAELFRTLCPKATLLDEDEVQSTIEGEEVMLQTDIPVTHWSMSQLSTSSWIPYVPAGRDGEEIKPARRLYKASTTFNVKFRDFKRMGQVCLDIAKNDDISIANLDWRLTNLTNEKLKLTVRRGAVKDAVVKALDYCSVFSPSAETVWECDAKEISDESSMGSVGYGGAAPRAMMMRSSGPGGGEKSLNFEPEDVSITARVHCKFECHEEGR